MNHKTDKNWSTTTQVSSSKFYIKLSEYYYVEYFKIPAKSLKIFLKVLINLSEFLCSFPHTDKCLAMNHRTDKNWSTTTHVLSSKFYITRWNHQKKFQFQRFNFSPQFVFHAPWKDRHLRVIHKIILFHRRRKTRTEDEYEHISNAQAMTLELPYILFTQITIETKPGIRDSSPFIHTHTLTLPRSHTRLYRSWICELFLSWKQRSFKAGLRFVCRPLRLKINRNRYFWNHSPFLSRKNLTTFICCRNFPRKFYFYQQILGKL